MAPILSARDRERLEYLYREAHARLISDLTSPRLRVLAALAPVTPLIVRTWREES